MLALDKKNKCKKTRIDQSTIQQQNIIQREITLCFNHRIDDEIQISPKHCVRRYQLYKFF